MSPFTAVVDANVLVPFFVRDLVLELSEAGVFRARWTPHIQAEVRRTLLGHRFNLPADKADLMLSLMHRNALQPMVTGYGPCIAGLRLPDADDRHVLAAAIASDADTIVTFNLKHFPAAALAEHGVEAVHPDAFLASQVTLQPGACAAVVRRLHARMTRPALSMNALLDRYRRNQLVHTADELEALLGTGA